MKNKTSSLKVYRTSLGNMAAGDWVSITTLSETAEFEFYQGFKTTQSSEWTKNEKYTLSMEMKEGMNLGFASSNLTIDEDYEYEITSDA